MAYVMTDDTNYEDIADAIREKNESSDTYLPSEMGNAIRAIRTGGDVTSVNGKTGAVVLSASDVGAGTYSKPSGGIPKSDLASAVQTSLGKADTAYSKPSGGIPKSDLASTVQTSLGKADTALQTAPVTSVNGKTGAVNITPADIEAKAVQTAVSDPPSTGSATTMAFISNITQNAQGVISPTKKTIPPASTSSDGIMTSQNVITMLAAYGMGNAAEYCFAPSSRHEATYPIKAGSIFTHGSSSSYGEWLYRALVDIANANQISSATAEQIRVSDLYNELRSAIAATYPTDTAEGAAVSISDGADDVPVKALSIAIESQIGVTGTTITQNGKNLLHDTLQSRTGNNKDNGFDVVVSDDGSFTVSGTRIANTHTRVVGVMYLQPGDYILTGCPANSGANKWRLRVGLGNGESTTNVGSDYGNGFAFTVQTAAYYTINYLIETTESVNLEFFPMVRAAGISNAAFEPYTVNTYEVDWTSEPGAITSGVLDVINGVLTTGGQDYDVTPADVRTLLGDNTIYADCGDVSVTYRADPTLQHDNLDAGDVRFIPYLGIYGNGTIGKAVRTLEDALFIVQNTISLLEAAIIGNKQLVFNTDGSVTWEEAPS